MIVPLVEEEAWLATLETVPLWSPVELPMAVVAPHPDDETLGAAGLIQAQRRRGVPVQVVAVTDGENAYGECPGLGPIRASEQAAALAKLGVEEEATVRLRLTDSAVSAQKDRLVEALLSMVQPNTLVVAPWRGDYHPDHEACGLAAEEVCRRRGAQLCSYFFWTWHRGTPEVLASLPLRRLPLSPTQLIAKQEALGCHQSQLFRDDGQPILPERLLAPAHRPFEIYHLHV